MARQNNGGKSIYAIQEQEIKNLQTQLLLNAISNLVLIIDNNQNIIMCNDALAAAVEIEREKIVGMNISILYNLLQFSCKEPYKKVSKNNIVYTSNETTFITQKGNKKHLLMDTAPIINNDKVVIGSICLLTDVTELKREESKKRHDEKIASLRLMAAGIVHEIRNPLTVIKGFSQIIQSQTDDEKIYEYANMIDKTANEVNQVVSDFLNFAESRPLILKDITLSALMNSMVLMIESSSFLHGIDLSLDIAGERCLLNVDENQIKQVILNIVRNSIEAMAGKDDSKLEISSYIDNASSQAIIKISDNGDGIGEENIKNLGTPFFTTRDTGRGLSLSIAYQILKKHGGEIEVNSKLGSGTSVTIALPYKSHILFGEFVSSNI